jgi:hypothetical protein
MSKCEFWIRRPQGGTMWCCVCSPGCRNALCWRLGKPKARMRRRRGERARSVEWSVRERKCVRKMLGAVARLCKLPSYNNIRHTSGQGSATRCKRYRTNKVWQRYKGQSTLPNPREPKQQGRVRIASSALPKGCYDQGAIRPGGNQWSNWITH